jgi:hypothetical protein
MAYKSNPKLAERNEVIRNRVKELIKFNPGTGIMDIYALARDEFREWNLSTVTIQHICCNKNYGKKCLTASR